MKTLLSLFLLMSTLYLSASDIVDLNDNGMDDAWEQLHGVDDPHADEDNDGIDNIFEYLYSLDPNVNNSNPEDADNYVDIITLYKGWNLLSIPDLQDEDSVVEDLFPSVFDGIWKWDSAAQEYVEAEQDKFSSKVGYWVFSDKEKVVPIERKKAIAPIGEVNYIPGNLGSLVEGHLETGNDGVVPKIEPQWGYELVGWVFEVDPAEPGKLNATAKYKIKSYTVTFDAGASGTITGGEVVQIVEHGQAAVAPTLSVNNDLLEFARWSENFAEVTSDLKVIAIYEDPSMVVIPAGTNSGDDPSYGDYLLTVDAFYMDKYEVTKKMWDEVATWASNNGYDIAPGSGKGKANNHPVQDVSWYECVKWCNARSELAGLTPCYKVGSDIFREGEQTEVSCSYVADGYRLPDEVEWEYAARGGVSGKLFPWGADQISFSVANYRSTIGYHPSFFDRVEPYTSPVGSFAANGYGLYDMAGNVWEWTNTKKSSSSVYRYLKGGSWSNLAMDQACGNSTSFIPTNSHNTRGFRTVRTGQALQ